MLQKLHGRVVAVSVYNHIFGNLCYSVYNAFVAVKRNAVLTVVAKFDCLTDIPLPLVARYNSLKEFDKCGLACAIVANDAKFFISCESVIEIVKNNFVAKLFRYVDRFKDFRPDI